MDSYEAILTWIEENGYEIIGNIREEFHMDDYMTDNPKEFVTEIQIPVKKRGGSQDEHHRLDKGDQ